jgi:site-specific recombinase XerD
MNNKYPQIKFVFDRRKIATPTIKSSVEMRISYNYKQKYLSTGIKLNSTQWKNGKIVNCPDIIQISQTLDKMISDVRRVILDMMNEGHIDITTIPERLKSKNQEDITFIQFCEQRAIVRKYGKEKDTQERYDRFLKHFKSWGKIIAFKDIEDSSIIAYDKHLINQGMMVYSKWNNYHRFLNGFISDAITEGYLHRNPYKWLNIPKNKESHGIDKCLTPSEFRKLKYSKMPTESLERVRDLFVFQTYTCLRYSDLRLFDARLIQEVKGMKMYIRAARKTRKQFTTPILSPAWNILMKYDGLLPIISNVKYNLYLKNVAQAAGIDKPLSTHWARHTGATLLINEAEDAKIIKKICGHSSIKITEQIYAKLLDETVVDAVYNLDI